MAELVCRECGKKRDIYRACSHCKDGSEDEVGVVYAHYVFKRELERALDAGRPAIALCGTTWQAGRSTRYYPACPECLKNLLTPMRP